MIFEAIEIALSVLLGFCLGIIYEHAVARRQQKIGAELLPTVVPCEPPTRVDFPDQLVGQKNRHRVSEYAPKRKSFMHVKPREDAAFKRIIEKKKPIERWVKETSSDGATRRQRTSVREAGLAASTPELMQGTPGESSTPLPSINWNDTNANHQEPRPAHQDETRVQANHRRTGIA